MDEILKHPLLQMDTPGIILAPTPGLGDFMMPVALEDVDPDLVKNLCIIWREQSESSMVGRLCSNE